MVLTQEDARADRGMSLVEVMVPLALFVLGSLSLLSVLTSTLSGTFDNRARVTAADLEVEYAGKPLSNRGVAATWNSFPSPGGYDVHRNDCSHITHTDAEPGSTPTVVRPLVPVVVNIVKAGSASRNRLTTISSVAGAACTENVTYDGNGNRTNSTCSNDCGIDVAVAPGTWRFATDSSSTEVTIAPWAPTTTINLPS